jgi:inositol phosphorylceramide mannosyltransferase catalytic subunit
MDDFPKIIHQIWIQGVDKIPTKFNENITYNKQYNPDWEYIIWDEDKITKLLKEYNPQWLETYNTLPYLHHKADFGRYVILYIYGGIYIDMDAHTIKSLDSLAQKYHDYDLLVSLVNTNFVENYIATWQTDVLINNGVIMSKPDNQIMLKIINSIVIEPNCEKYDTQYTCIQRITGPKKFSSMIYKNLDDNVKILSYDYFEPCILSYCDITPNTYIIHKHEGSWYSNKLKKIGEGYLYIKNDIILLIFILLILLYLVYKSNT